LSTAPLLFRAIGGHYHPRMKKKHARTITPQDRAAAARLLALWEAKSRDERPTQEEMAHQLGGKSQSLVSQYLHAKISLNYRAVLAFSAALKCPEESIRDDLPEQLLAKDARSSHPVSTESSTLSSRRRELGLSNADVHARMLALPWPDGIKPPDLPTVIDWLEGRRRPFDMFYRGMLYKALDMGAGGDVPMGEGVARTEVGAQVLKLIESVDPEEAAHVLALLKAMSKGKP
jgi:hypothetical protein